MKCDCLVEVDDVDMTPGGIKTTYVIRYCPMHANADKLLTFLKRICDDNALHPIAPALWDTSVRLIAEMEEK